jgi:hypothetical protein
MVLRHGSRYPSTKQAKRSIDFLKSLRQNSKSSFLNEIDETTFENKPHYGLTELGGLEMKQIGDRFRKRYSHLVENLQLSDVSFISSSKPRSIESGTNFTHRLFQEMFQNKDFLNILKINDEMLRGFDLCKVYVKKIKENLGANKEYNLFKEEKIVRNLVDGFRKRHFIDDNFQLDISR